MAKTQLKRPPWNQYFMNIAYNVAERSNCIRRQIGAVIVKDFNIISTGYNGTPMGVTNCCDGGCPRCASDVPSGHGVDTCICCHAEENAICFAARHGARTNDSVLYSTTRPCFGCLKKSIQAGVVKIYYVEPYDYADELEEVYQKLVAESGMSLVKLEREEEAGD